MPALFVTALVAAFVLLNVVVIAIVLPLWKKFAGNVDGTMRQLAEQTELSPAGGDPVLPKVTFLNMIRRPLRIEGSRRGCDVRIYHYSTGGRNRTTYATVRIAVENPRGLRLGFSRESILGKLGKSLGMQDVRTGDERFDRLFIVKCSDPAFVRQALLPEIKQRFYEVWEQHKAQGAISLRDDTLAYDEVGTIRNDAVRNRIAAVTELMCDLGGVVGFYNRQT